MSFQMRLSKYGNFERRIGRGLADDKERKERDRLHRDLIRYVEQLEESVKQRDKRNAKLIREAHTRIAQ